MTRPVVTIEPRAIAFTAVCPECARTLPEDESWASSSFAGRLDLDLASGVYLCRNGHSIRVERAEPSAPAASEAA